MGSPDPAFKTEGTSEVASAVPAIFLIKPLRDDFKFVMLIFGLIVCLKQSKIIDKYINLLDKNASAQAYPLKVLVCPLEFLVLHL